jgi:hypothetical protein
VANPIHFFAIANFTSAARVSDFKVGRERGRSGGTLVPWQRKVGVTVIAECCATITIYNGSRRTLTYGSGCIHYEGYVRTTLAAPLNPYQAGSFERTQCAALGVRLYAPFLQH